MKPCVPVVFMTRERLLIQLLRGGYHDKSTVVFCAARGSNRGNSDRDSESAEREMDEGMVESRCRRVVRMAMVKTRMRVVRRMECVVCMVWEMGMWRC